MRHIVLRPRAGIGNRMRAIASMRRLCAGWGARLTVVEDCPEMFEPMPDVEWSRETFAYPMVNHPHGPKTWTFPEGDFQLVSCYGFGEGRSMTEGALRPWLPTPAADIRLAAEAFGPFDVGVHIRRTDNVRALKFSPETDYAVPEGATVFVTSDDPMTVARWCRRPGTTSRPRAYDRVHDRDAMLDLAILAYRCGRVIGSGESSFSRIAVLLNGSADAELVGAGRNPTSTSAAEALAAVRG